MEWCVSLWKAQARSLVSVREDDLGPPVALCILVNTFALITMLPSWQLRQVLCACAIEHVTNFFDLGRRVSLPDVP